MGCFCTYTFAAFPDLDIRQVPISLASCSVLFVNFVLSFFFNQIMNLAGMTCPWLFITMDVNNTASPLLLSLSKNNHIMCPEIDKALSSALIGIVSFGNCNNHWSSCCLHSIALDMGEKNVLYCTWDNALALPFYWLTFIRDTQGRSDLMTAERFLDWVVTS